MTQLVQILIGGLATGAIYALIAIGFTLLWQTSQTINFAQGEFVMLPAFFVLIAMSSGLPFWVAALIGVVVSALVLGVFFKKALIDPMLRHGVLPLAIATMALSIFLKESVKSFYSAEAQPFPALVPARDLHLGPVTVSLQDIATLAIAILAVALLQWFLAGTSAGKGCASAL